MNSHASVGEQATFRQAPEADAVGECAANVLEADGPGRPNAIEGRTLTEDPSTHAAEQLRGRIAFEQKRYGEGRAVYHEAPALKRRDVETLLDVGRVMYESLAFEEAP